MSESLCPLVAIGASAGGLEPLTQILQSLPEDTGLTFVVIQHLDPKHKSALPELLARATKMPVAQAADGMTTKPNHVYVIAPNSEMEIEGCVLRLAPRPEAQRGAFLPIDRFFRSLARNHGNKAIGVILSGTGSDGSLGLAEIKETGGITFAQEERTAKFPGMPHSAVVTRAVDFSLSPEEIVAELKRIVRHPYVAAPRDRKKEEAPPAGQDGLSQVLGLVRSAMATDFTHYKNSTIARRITRRMTLRKIETVDAYVEYLRKTPAELEALYHDLLIKVTSFFRDPETYEALSRVVVPAILRDHPPNKPIRVWVAGCASGEEAYSIAICFLEGLGERASETALRVFATDVDDAALAKARAGVYLENIAADVSEHRLQRFFTKGERTFQINKSIREMCTFARHDLCKDPPFSGMDLISCRNVLIYFESVLQKRVIPIFHYALNPDGFLTLGASETVGASSELFTLEDRKNKVYKRNPGKTPGSFDFGPRDFRVEEAGRFHPSKLAKQLDKALEPQKEADQVLLHYFAPVGVLVDERRQILEFRGHTDRYLVPAPGKPSLDILKMAREGLLGALRGALDEATSAGVPVERKGVRVKSGHAWLSLTLKVIPTKRTQSAAQHFMVLFEEPAPRDVRPERAPPRKTATGRQTLSEENAVLRQELEATRQHLQSIIEEQEATNEELRSAHEEVLSANEEMQSTNEELETAKEELQSTNEELVTANDELQRRNTELAEANNELRNLYVNARLPLVMVGSDLRIRRLTEVAENLFGIRPTDVGRPMSELRLNIQGSGIESVASAVVKDGIQKELEVQDQKGIWYSLQIRPYRDLEGKVNGAVLLFIDLTAVKSAEKLVSHLEEVRAARDYSDGIIQTMREALLVLNADLEVISANPAYYDTFKTAREATERKRFFALMQRALDQPDLRKVMERVLPEDSEFRNFEAECDLPNIGKRTLVFNGRRIALGGKGTEMVLIALEDVTDRREAERKLKLFAADLEKSVAELGIANKELEAFSYSIAHDLRSPIRSITSYSQLVLRKAKGMDADAQAYLNKSIFASRRMAKLIDDLLELARLSRKELMKEPLDISSVARSIAEELRQEQADRQVEFRVASGLQAKGDSDLVQIALHNLLDNAWKFTRKTPKAVIEVGQTQKDGKTAFFVRDNGAGFDMAYAKKLFGVFQRLHSEEDFPGTGIGLVTVQRIIHRHGGRIWAEADVNHGAAFFFTLETERP